MTELKIGLVAVHTSFGDWVSLSVMKKLKHLSIRAHCGSFDPVPAQICNLTSLESLTVEYSDSFLLPQEGMSKLVNLTSYSIRPLQLRDDEYSNAGFPPTFDVPPNLKKITLERCHFWNANTVALLSASLEELELSPSPEITPQVLETICRLPKLKRLKVSFPPYWTAELCEEFRTKLGPILV